MTSTPAASTTEQMVLGEGARWDARRDELLRVDVAAGRVYRDRVDGVGGLLLVRTYEVPGTVGAITPVEGDEGWLLASNRGFAHLSEDGTLRRLADVAPEGARMNDGACDPQGRFWAGTKAHDNRVGGGALYRLGRDGNTELVLGGLTISNGLGWSPDGLTMYLADTVPRVIHAFAFDGDRERSRTAGCWPRSPREPDPTGLRWTPLATCGWRYSEPGASSATPPTVSCSRNGSYPPSRPRHVRSPALG